MNYYKTDWLIIIITFIITLGSKFKHPAPGDPLGKDDADAADGEGRPLDQLIPAQGGHGGQHRRRPARRRPAEPGQGPGPQRQQGEHSGQEQKGTGLAHVPVQGEKGAGEAREAQGQQDRKSVV